MGEEEPKHTKGSEQKELKPVLEPSTIKAFVAGIVIGNLNKGVLLGFTIGALGGLFIQQNFTGIPNVSRTWKDLLNRWKETGRSSSEK